MHAKSPLDTAESLLIAVVNTLDEAADEANASDFTDTAKQIRRICGSAEETLRQVQHLRDGDSREGY